MRSTEKEKVLVSFEEPDIPASVKNFRPDVYQDGGIYYCILGADADAITGSGDTVMSAMKEWDKALRQKTG